MKNILLTMAAGLTLAATFVDAAPNIDPDNDAQRLLNELPYTPRVDRILDMLCSRLPSVQSDMIANQIIDKYYSSSGAEYTGLVTAITRYIQEHPITAADKTRINKRLDYIKNRSRNVMTHNLIRKAQEALAQQ